MTPDDYEGEINRLIAAEQYVDAERLVREYAACMVETCLGPAAEERFQRAKRFLQTTLGIVRARSGRTWCTGSRPTGFKPPIPCLAPMPGTGRSAADGGPPR
jgi:hypothetical protein